MNSQKGFIIPIIIVIIALLVIGGEVYFYENNKREASVNIPDVISNISTTTTSNIVGGDKDEHGCLGSAGYSWCEVKNKCLRVWEEKCIATSTLPAVTVLSPNGGEIYKKGDTVLIRWKAYNIDSTININLLKAEGGIYYDLGTQINPSTGSQVDASGPAFSWWIPTDDGPGGRRIETGIYKIQIIALEYDDGRGIADTSDNYFTIN